MKQITVITPTSEDAGLHTGFGISDDRAATIDKHLQKTAIDAYEAEETKSTASVLVLAASIAENEEELLYIGFAMGFNAGHQANPFAQLLQGIEMGEETED